jgi:hypothetical protein
MFVQKNIALYVIHPPTPFKGGGVAGLVFNISWAQGEGVEFLDLQSIKLLKSER